MKRQNNYDNLKGILIFLVVLGHFYYCNESNSYIDNVLLNFIYSFHMPLFMIITGYFSKYKVEYNKLFKYFILFIFLNISFSLYDYFFTNRFNLFNLKYSSWYLILVIIYRLIICNKHIPNILNDHKRIVLIISFVICNAITIINFPLFIIRIFIYFFFFLFGYLYDESRYKTNKILLPVILFLLFSMVVLFNLPIDFYLGQLSNYPYILPLKIIFNVLDILLFILLISIISNKKILAITKIGKYSLYIYIFHRIPTLLLQGVNNKFYIILSIIICIIFSSSFVIKFVEKVLNICTNNKVISTVFILILLSCLFLFDLYSNNKIFIKELSPKEEYDIDNSISIGFVGDLILLENQVNASKIDDGYSFDYMFKYTNKYFKNTDYVVGVFEGVSDDNKKYSIGNYDDGKELRLNYPPEFIKSIKKSGIDLVTTSNNHVYDRGYSSAVETINNLNKYKLDYVGYKNNNMKIANVHGVKIGFISYTYGTNYKTDDKEIVEYIVDKNNKKYKKIKNKVENDIKSLKDKSDLVIVLPHYGTEFNTSFDSFQRNWNNIFINSGADIIFGDHSHVIGPINYKNNKYILSSPGNYVNSYIGHDSDISNYIKIYIDKNSKQVINSSVIPLLANKKDRGYYPISLYDLDKNKKRKERVKYAKELFGKVIFNNKNIALQEEYFYKNNRLKYIKKNSLKQFNKNSIVYKKIDEHKKICFVGDSITEGYLNNTPWYKDLMNLFKNKEVINISKNSYTSFDVLNNFSDDIKNSSCDLSIINIGTNDIRYNKTSSQKYLNNIKKIISFTKDDVILLAPWKTYSKDKKMKIDKRKKEMLYDEYNKVLKKYSDNLNNIYFYNQNIYIKKIVEYNGEDEYLLDGVHPNSTVGIRLYSYSVMQ